VIDGVRRVLVLGAHPDDEMACAGTISRLAGSGAHVTLVTFSRCRDMIPAGFRVEDLEAEWQAGCELLGVAASVLHDVPNRHFPAHRQDILEILDEFRLQPFDLVLVPSVTDSHQDHSTVGIEATRIFKWTTIWGYELPINSVSGGVPNVFVRLDPAHVEAKIAHIQTYRTQADRPYMNERYVRGLVAVRGLQCGAEAAEAFSVIREVT